MEMCRVKRKITNGNGKYGEGRCDEGKIDDKMGPKGKMTNGNGKYGE